MISLNIGSLTGDGWHGIKHAKHLQMIFLLKTGLIKCTLKQRTIRKWKNDLYFFAGAEVIESATKAPRILKKLEQMMIRQQKTKWNESWRKKEINKKGKVLEMTIVQLSSILIFAKWKTKSFVMSMSKSVKENWREKD